MRADARLPKAVMTLVLLLSALSLVAAEGGGGGPFVDSSTGVDGVIVVDGSASGGGGGGGGGGGTSSTGSWPPAPSGPPMEAVTIRSIPNRADGYCILVEVRLFPAGAAADAARSRNVHMFFIQYDHRTADGTVLQPCPDSSTPIDLTPLYTFADSVTGQLPLPTLELEPGGRAITGNTAYLETNRPLRYGPVTQRLDLGAFSTDVTIFATGSYTVAWGDSPAGPATPDGNTYTVPGSPYPGTGPDGRVAHTYLDTGSFPLTVVDRWVVTIRAGGLSEMTRTAPPITRSITVRVDEVRSDRDS